MITTVYFVRHAEPDTSIHEDLIRPLTEKGTDDCKYVTQFLKDKNIQIALSSPYKRSVDTILPFAQEIGLQIETIADFRERRVESGWIEDFNGFVKRQWADFSYKLSDGECLSEVQQRNIKALEKILAQHSGKNIVIGTHGTALSTMINYYDETYGYEDFQKIAGVFPWLVVMKFDGQTCVEIEKIDLFELDEK